MGLPFVKAQRRGLFYQLPRTNLKIPFSMIIFSFAPAYATREVLRHKLSVEVHAESITGWCISATFYGGAYQWCICATFFGRGCQMGILNVSFIYISNLLFTQ